MARGDRSDDVAFETSNGGGAFAGARDEIGALHGNVAGVGAEYQALRGLGGPKGHGLRIFGFVSLDVASNMFTSGLGAAMKYYKINDAWAGFLPKISFFEAHPGLFAAPSILYSHTM